GRRALRPYPRGLEPGTQDRSDAELGHSMSQDVATGNNEPQITAYGLELSLRVREARLLTDPPSVRPLGKLGLEVHSEGWRFPLPIDTGRPSSTESARAFPAAAPLGAGRPGRKKTATRLQPPRD